MKKLTLILFLLSSFASFGAEYPSHWWKKINDPNKPDWEILPHEAGLGELVLSKRNELGIFSNFAHTPFEVYGDRYASIEGFWQMMKFPDPTDSKDRRNLINFEYPFRRSEVMMMHGFEAKDAGNAAGSVMKKYAFRWVTFKHKKFNYKDNASGSRFHYKIISQAIAEKIKQNPKAYKLLMMTKGLKLIPDHHQDPKSPPAYFYHKILMKIRDSKTFRRSLGFAPKR